MNDYYVNYCNAENFKSTHTYRWAKAKARQGCHCTCDELPPNARLIYTGIRGDNEFRIHVYNKYGFTVAIMPVSDIDAQSTTWRLYGKCEPFPLVPLKEEK